MPGNSLSSLEKRLLKVWEAEHHGGYPLLKAICVSAPLGRGLRGIKNLRIDLNYPVTFFSGQNGSGKSTILSLAALAFHGVPGHIPLNAKRHSGSGGSRFGYYTFQDFFYKGPGDSDVSGLQISWEFSGGKKISIAKQSDKWMHYERRPLRPVEFLGLSRAVPAIELSILRNHFRIPSANKSEPLGREALKHLQNVLKKDYPGAEVLSGAKYSIRRSSREGGYTSFNMGTGEDAMFTLLAHLENAPEGSLIVVEELETGLHPAAQRRIVTAILELALQRKLQIIGSTHSHHVLDCLPKIARALLVREGDGHRVVDAPSTRLALSELSEINQCELLVLCEDEFGCAIVRQALPHSIRKRVDVVSAGAKSELCLSARNFLRLSPKAKCLLVWDGDVSTEEAEKYLEAGRKRFEDSQIDSRLSWSRLPGGCCPELWVLNTVANISIDEVVHQFNFDSIDAAKDVLRRCGRADPHSIVFELSELTGLDEVTTSAYLIQSAVTANPELKTLVDSILAQLV